MQWFEIALRYTHIIFGFVGLAAFWIPVLTRKGGRQHVRYGNVFLWCAYVVLGSAGISVCYRVGFLLSAGQGPRELPVQFSFLLFLGYLSYVTFVNIRHAIMVLRYKRDPQTLRTRVNRMLAASAMLASLLLVAYTLYFSPSSRIILLALSPIGFLIGYGILRYLSGENAPKSWLYEHLGGMLGGGIAFHTAFAVFGGARLFNFGLEGGLAVIPWVLPTLIGVPATAIWTRHYKNKFAQRDSKHAGQTKTNTAAVQLLKD